MRLDEAQALARIRETPGVSHETFGRLQTFVGLLTQWQQRINLVSPTTLPEVWGRHILDSLQLLSLAPDARHWIDIGAGGGLPGLVVGCVLAEKPGARVDLVESNAKKGAFLRHVSATLGLPVQVHVARIEACLSTLPVPDVISARALASLDQLLGFTNLLLKSGATGLFPKGREVQDELTQAARSWHFRSVLHPSVTDPQARIVEITMSAQL